MEPGPTAATRTDTSGTPECDVLLKIATPDVYRQNSFRILGLPVSTSLRETAKEVNRRQMLAELGQTGKGTHSQLEIRPEPTIDDLRAAEAVLHDPGQRLVHELFWFWPLEPLLDQPDSALQAIKAGDLKTAASLWDSARKDAGMPIRKSAIAKHNTAVRWHFQVLDLEAATEGRCWDGAQAENVRKTWAVVLAYWNDSIRGDAIWNALSARVIELNDERASLEFVQSMRKTAGRAILKINATLALRYVDCNAGTAALSHLTLLLDSSLYTDNSLVVDEFLVAPLKESVRQRIRDAEAGRAGDPSQAKDIAHRLIAKFSGYLPLLNRLVDDGDTYDLAGLCDEVVSECLACAIAYHDKTNDAPSSIALLEDILPFARSGAIRGKVEENIKIAKGNLLFEEFAPLREALAELEDSKEAPNNRLSEFVLTIEPLIEKLGAVLSTAGPVPDLISDRIAGLVRNIAIDAWNTTKDERTAFNALGRADKFARSEELKKQLAADRATLVRLYAEERRQRQTKKNKRYTWYVGIGIAVAIIIALNVDNGSSPHGSSQGAASTGFATSGTESASTDAERRTYSVPQYMVHELARDRTAAEAAQREAATLETQLADAHKELDAKRAAARMAKAKLDDFRQRLELTRLYVSRNNPIAMARFNREVDSYNRMVAKVHEKIVAVNALVGRYNALLARAKAKADEAERLVHAYNQKLVRVSH